jgi:ribulose-5-phosphate 4-epimerase/fuculose-1-phosphate aldolase
MLDKLVLHKETIATCLLGDHGVVVLGKTIGKAFQLSDAFARMSSHSAGTRRRSAAVTTGRNT